MLTTRPPVSSARFRRRTRGQSLAEFAIVFPIFIAMIGGIIQFGLVFWAQNTLTQVVRDTGRWEATQIVDPCSSNAGAVVGMANTIASNSSLFGYSLGNPFVAGNATEGIDVAWARDPSDSTTQPCPPTDNQSVWYVTITIRHTVPTFFPGMTYLPGLGTCDSAGCHLTLASTAKYRMEPQP